MKEAYIVFGHKHHAAEQNPSSKDKSQILILGQGQYIKHVVSKKLAYFQNNPWGYIDDAILLRLKN